jgi:hypothetical protein
MSDIQGEMLKHTAAEDKLIRRLGSAVVLQWVHLPVAVQQRILRQARTVFDAEPIPIQLKQELEAFIGRHQLPKS